MRLRRSHGAPLPVPNFCPLAKTRRSFGAALILALSAGPLYAQSAAQKPLDREQERTALYREGVHLAEDGRWDEALKRFQSVVEIRSAPAALVALGTAQEKLAMLATARRTFAKARDEARTVGDDAIAEKATHAVATLEPRVPRLILRLSRKTPDTVVTIDGQRVEMPDDGVELDPGDHEVVVTVEGQPHAERARIVEGQRKELWINDAPPPVESGVSSGPPVGPLVLGGSGVVAAAVGAIVWVSNKSVYDNRDAAKTALCPQDQSKPSGSCQNAVAEGNSARDRAAVGSVVGWTGAAAIVVAGAWWLLSPSGAPAQRRGSSAVDLSAGAAPGSYWISVSSAF
jgi:hypothetical protein